MDLRNKIAVLVAAFLSRALPMRAQEQRIGDL